MIQNFRPVDAAEHNLSGGLTHGPPFIRYDSGTLKD
jgi:hypothetical protein